MIVECPKCHLEWESPCEQTNSIELLGECISCHFIKPGPYNKHGTGVGTAEELMRVSPLPINLEHATDTLNHIRSITSE